METQVGSKQVRGAGRRGVAVAGLVALTAVFVSGCFGPGAVHVDAAGLPGVYRNDDTGAEIRLDTNGRFSAVGLSQDQVSRAGRALPLGEFGGTWNPTPSNFVYLESDRTEGRPGPGDFQLWTVSSQEVYLHPDVDGPITLRLFKVEHL
ncbi:hypothetical protein ACN20G_26475 (plasmid) [Streptomyces sp. BI20]|uniref:hypothetical protein n=1 Tax=Streptomyces sp. BI20 TaxID=3403460 RepID=UPI003C745144